MRQHAVGHFPPISGPAPTYVDREESPHSVPYHLKWMQSVWNKKSLDGNYYEMPHYGADSADFRAAKDVTVYLIDSQVDWQHSDLSRLDAQLGYPGYDCTPRPAPALIAGQYSGVNPQATLMPFRLNKHCAWAYIIAAFAEIQILQAARSGQRAVISASWSIALKDFKTEELATPSDPFEVLVPQLRELGVDLVVAAGNDGERRNDEAKANTPQIWSGNAGSVIAVGAAAYDSDGTGFSTWVYSVTERLPNHEFPDIYNLGTDILAPQWAKGGRSWGSTEGTSPATAITAALQVVAEGKKGNAWLADDRLPEYNPDDEEGMDIPDPGSVPDDKLYLAPRAATTWEIACAADGAVPMGPEDCPQAYFFPKDKLFQLDAHTFDQLDGYLMMTRPRCFSVEERDYLDPSQRHLEEEPFPR
ncbi:peptidase S8/S53 domain-containing protein [Coniochaeta sp. 2T2.1]|nr:peptidase S8/S53 domain-containing protein [Coniochaeta sp. 2T2.1]